MTRPWRSGCWPKSRYILALPLEAYIACTHYPCQREGSKAKQQVSCLDQPVQAAYENPGLRQSKDRKDEGVHDSNCSQQPRAPGSNHHDTEYQQGEGYCEAKQHVNVYVV